MCDQPRTVFCTYCVIRHTMLTIHHSSHARDVVLDWTLGICNANELTAGDNTIWSCLYANTQALVLATIGSRQFVVLKSSHTQSIFILTKMTTRGAAIIFLVVAVLAALSTSTYGEVSIQLIWQNTSSNVAWLINFCLILFEYGKKFSVSNE